MTEETQAEDKAEEKASGPTSTVTVEENVLHPRNRRVEYDGVRFEVGQAVSGVSQETAERMEADENLKVKIEKES